MTKRILLIEDDMILQKAINEALTDAGFVSIFAFNGEEGLRKAREDKPDLILLDLILLGKSGYRVLAEINKDEQLRNIPVIILTVLGSNDSRRKCKQLGAVDYLLKSDCALREIVKKIKKNC